MIPLRDNIPSSTTPVVNYAMIGLCAVVFLIQWSEGDEAGSLVERFGMIPARVSHPDVPVEIRERLPQPVPGGYRLVETVRDAAPSAVPAKWTLLTCVFLHGGWLHFLGNMWFLRIFGDNVEDRFGHVGYAVLYLGCGVAASLAHYFSAPESTVPTIGASGAIAGVMGAYFVLYPRALVEALVPIVWFVQIVVLPAPIFLGIWFLLQFVSGTASINAAESTGVAWWAHVGGFVVGAVAAAVLGRSDRLRPRVEIVRPGRERVSAWRIRPRDDR